MTRLSESLRPERSRFVEREGARVHYRLLGERSDEGRALVFLAGAGTDSRVWARQAELLADRALVILIDHRGSGQSDRPDGSYSADLLADDLDRVLEAEGLPAVSVIGYSMGGLIAQRYVSTRPERVERLALINCTLGGVAHPGTVLPEREVVNTFLFGAALDDADLIASALDFHFGPDWRERHRALADETRPIFELNVGGISHLLPILVSPEPLIDDLSAVTCPVLCLFSRDDVVTPVANAESARAALPQARVEIFEGHHASMLLHPERTHHVLEDFLALGLRD